MRYILLLTVSLFSIFLVNAQVLPNYGQRFVIQENPNTVFPNTIDLSLNQKDSIINQQYYGKTKYTNNWLFRKIRHEHLYKVRTKDFQMNISPLLVLDMGKTKGTGQKINRNTRGVLIEANIDQKFGFTSTFFENQSGLMEHVADYALYTGVVPGQGPHKKFHDTLYDYAWAEGLVYFKPNPHWDIQFGHGKRFVGNGYRSMLYSDNAMANMHAFFSWKKNKFRYYTWVASFTSPNFPDPEHPHETPIKLNLAWPKKAGNFHVLEFMPNNKFNIGFFEGSILASREASGKYKFNPLHYNPIILVNSFSKKANSILGTNFQANFNDLAFYGQLATMSNNRSNMAFQLGSRFLRTLHRGSVFILGEINHANRGMYTYSDTSLSYTQYNQPIAHPLGEDFTEFIFQSKICFLSLELEYKYNTIWGKSDPSGNLPGINLFYTRPNQMYLQKNSNRSVQEIKVSYIINPHYDLRLTLGAFIRNFKSSVKESNFEMIYVSFQTPIFNRYYDF